MINLIGTGEKIEIVASAAGSLDWVSSWADWDNTVTPQTGRDPDGDGGNLATATNVAVVTGDATYRRNPLFLNVYNASTTISNGVTVRAIIGGGTRLLWKITLLPGEWLTMNDAGVFFAYDANGGVKASSSAVGVDPMTNGFRLSGVSATPVMTADSTTLSTVYLCQYKNNRIALHDGIQWQMVSPATEISLAVTGRTTDLPFDVFGFLSSGTVALEFLNWTSATARATNIVRVDGVWTKSGDTTRRYLGSIRARSATTYHWVRGGVDLPAKFDLFNADNRVEFGWSCIDSATSHAYTVATIRQWAGSVNYQCDIMVGLQEEDFGALGFSTSRNATISIPRSIGIGLDSTTQYLAGSLASSTANTVISIDADQSCRMVTQPAIGRHFAALLEWSSATGTCTWLGDNGGAGTTLTYQSGLAGEWTC